MSTVMVYEMLPSLLMTLLAAVVCSLFTVMCGKKAAKVTSDSIKRPLVTAAEPTNQPPMAEEKKDEVFAPAAALVADDNVDKSQEVTEKTQEKSRSQKSSQGSAHKNQKSTPPAPSSGQKSGSERPASAKIGNGPKPIRELEQKSVIKSHYATKIH